MHALLYPVRKFHFLFTVTLLLLSFQAISQKQLTIGIVSDFNPSGPQYEAFIESMKSEIQQTVGSSYTVVIPHDQVRAASWDKGKAKEGYESLLSSSDVILLLGSVSVGAVAERSDFPKPTIGLGVFDTDIQHIPITDRGTSGVKNFSYVLTSQPLDKELTEFHKIIPFKRLTILGDEKQIKAFDTGDANKQLMELMKGFNASFDFVLIGDNVQEAMNKIGPETDAVYIGIPYGRSDQEMAEIADYLIKRKLPSFTMAQDHIEQGIMACISDNNGISQLLRKMALITEEAVMGEDIGNTAVSLSYQEKLYINIGTADAIGFSPSFDILFSAEIVGEQAIAAQNTYSVTEIISKSIEANLDIQISKQDLELAKKDYALAKSEYLPQVDVSATALQIDNETASNSNGQAPETKITGTGRVQQVIYSEGVIAGIKINEYLKKAQEFAVEQQMVDVIFTTFEAYFTILKAKTNIRIQEENLKATQNNLELAKVRVHIGASGKDELYRWESESANAKQSLIQARISHFQAMLRLNQVLNNQLGDEFDVKDATLEDEVFQEFAQSKLGKYLNSPADLELFSDFLVQMGIENFPSEKQLVANTNAIERQMIMNKRQFYAPTVAVQGQADNIFNRSGAGSDPVSFIPGTEPADQIDFSWNVAVTASLPIFQKNQRRINLQRTQVQLDQLAYQKRNLDQNVELAVRSRVLDVVASGTNVNFSKISAENSDKNFDIVQDNYKKGTVSIIQLIDAQKAALSARQAFANSVYDYLLSFISLESSIGVYSMLATEEEKAAFNQQYLQFIQENQK